MIKRTGDFFLRMISTRELLTLILNSGLGRWGKSPPKFIGNRGAFVFVISFAIFGCKSQLADVKDDLFWRGYRNRSLSEKIISAPSAVVAHLRRDNELDGWTERPEAAHPTEDILNDIRAALDELPSTLKAITIAHASQRGGEEIFF